MTATKNILVIGGGVAGIQASLDLADKGINVYLVEREPSIGGIMALLDKTFPTNDCSICILAPKMNECFANPNIRILTNSELISLEGEAPDFRATIVKKARFVDEKKCTGCGDCTQKCPVKVPNKYNMNLDKRKAIYLPFPQSVPRIMTIDKERCLKFTKDKCGNCIKVCKAGAIDYEQNDEKIVLDVGAVIVASGFEIYNPSDMFEYGYGKYSNVKTAMEYERLICASGPTGGHLVVEPGGERPKRLGFIQCVGSRDLSRKNPYCSSVCCMHATKEAMLAKEHYDDIETYIFFLDLRAVGKNFQQYVDRAKKDYGIKYLRARPGRIMENEEKGTLTIWYDDLIDPHIQSIDVDMVVLCTALMPSSTAPKMGEILGIELDEYGFFCAKDPLANPVCSTKKGIFIAGYCAGPKDIPESVAEASGASARASEVIAQSGGGDVP
ncbi:MAG: CoB--CoM heterodisulfide reductase iron-sulfur subunit A family protein [Thermoplasmata archaeon]|nr:MAG: CoB--CoM heterodisulfide reductase iron-sulfur subunit A family protein [Thermoplasmata archaeon]